MILALAGLAGAGKTTAIEMLAAAGRGTRLYVGGIVTEEVERRGLPLSAESERLVRGELRRDGGMGVLARAALPRIEAMESGGNVLIDAIYNDDERAIYADRFGADFAVLGIRTPNSLRAARLSSRNQRPLTSDELTRRDEYELGALRLGDVLERADRGIDNSGSLDQLEHALQTVFATLI